MALTSIGDMAQGFMLRHHNSHLKTEMNRLVQEMSSGKAADISRHLSGSYSYLADVDRNLSVLEGYASAASEAEVLASGMQKALENFQTVGSDLGAAALAASNSHLADAVQTASERAKGDFQSMVASLNTGIGGRSLFSGTAVDSPALASAEDMLADLRTALAGETTLSGVSAALDTWFDTPGGGFETVGYTGGNDTLTPIAVSEGQTLELAIKADDPAFRESLKAAAMAALAADESLGFDADLQSDMMKTAGLALSVEQNGVIRLRADIGMAEARVEEAQSRISAEKTGFEIARTDLLSVDPYETATQLEDTQFQLESLYAVTVRMSRLSLVEYLK